MPFDQMGRDADTGCAPRDERAPRKTYGKQRENSSQR